MTKAKHFAYLFEVPRGGNVGGGGGFSRGYDIIKNAKLMKFWIFSTDTCRSIKYSKFLEAYSDVILKIKLIFIGDSETPLPT